MRHNYFLNERQTYTIPSRLGCEERNENPLKVFDRYARACIPYSNMRVATLPACVDES
jgi:hypothetical protein